MFEGSVTGYTPNMESVFSAFREAQKKVSMWPTCSAGSFVGFVEKERVNYVQWGCRKNAKAFTGESWHQAVSSRDKLGTRESCVGSGHVESVLFRRGSNRLTFA